MDEIQPPLHTEDTFMSKAAHGILVVEDQRLIAADIENTLKKLGYAVVGNVSSGEDAVSGVDQLRPGLVLMDVRLSGEMDGIEAAGIIRDRFNVPVVYLAAYADEEAILRAKETTPFGYLVKPFNERDLRATIEIAFYTHQMERTLADERARRHAAEEFKILVDGVRDYAIFMLDPNGHVTTWNKGAERLKGYKEDEIKGKDFSIFYTEEARQAGHPNEFLQTALREGRSEEENWRVRKDGTQFWASVVMTPISNESGTLIGFAKVTRDLTEHRVAEAKREAERHEAQRVLRESEEMFRLLVDQVRDYAIFFLDPEGHVMTWNAGAERIKGYRADEIISLSFVRFYLPQDVVAGLPNRLMRRATEHGVATDEGVRLRKDGSRFWASVVLTALRDKSGRLRGFAKVTRDITEQRHAEQSLAILADASRLLAESLDSDQILFTITRMVVPAFADGVAIHLRDAQGEPCLHLFHAANPELLAAVRDLQVKGAYRVAAPSRRVMRTGRSELHPQLTPEWLRGQEMDDELMFLIKKFGISSTIHVPIIVGVRPFAVIVFAAAGTRVYNENDLVFAEELARRASTAMHNAELFQTAKEERERAEESAALRERLIAIVGHDLRNPLTSIRMAAHMLSSSALAASEEELVSRLQRSANRMTRMIDQILDFARIRSGQSFALQFESVDLRQISQSVIDELRLSSPDQKIALSIEGRADAIIDSDRIAQVLSNLIGNAIKYGSAGPISVTIRETTPDAVAIDVHNFGPAIPKSAQARIFEAFNREAAGENRLSIGLGLFIAKEIVRAHGGLIAVRSPDRDGTTFSVVLPRRPRLRSAA
jgi:PAS domain S-box-containing protein